MNNHTPGPWKVGTKYATDIYADRAGHAIARTCNPQAEGESEANARLMAAAPELLLACQNLMAGVDDSDMNPNFVYARAAIEKALLKKSV